MGVGGVGNITKNICLTTNSGHQCFGWVATSISITGLLELIFEKNSILYILLFCMHTFVQNFLISLAKS